MARGAARGKRPVVVTTDPNLWQHRARPDGKTAQCGPRGNRISNSHWVSNDLVLVTGLVRIPNPLCAAADEPAA